MELPGDFFVKPVDGHDDLLAFSYGFVLEGKALEDDASSVTVADNGDLIIEGYAAVFDGLDREGENFVPGAFQRGIKSFLNSPAALCFHHKKDTVLGKVLDLREEEGKGLFMRARVDHQPESSPLRYLYEQVKKGTLNGLSVGGFFKRVRTPAGPRIADMDFTEISVTGVPVHTGPRFAVVAGKALQSLNDVEVPQVPQVDGDVREEDLRTVEYLLDEVSALFRRIEENVGKRGSSTAD